MIGWEKGNGYYAQSDTSEADKFRLMETVVAVSLPKRGERCNNENDDGYKGRDVSCRGCVDATLLPE